MAETRPRRSPLVAIAADVREFDNYHWHASPRPYLEAAARVAGATPLIVPALGDAIDIEAVLDRVDGVLLSGSRTNVHPARYGVEPSSAYEPYDEARDSVAIPLIRSTLARGLPLFAICRGMQELNVALGGSIATEIQTLSGRIDHRAPESSEQDARFAIRQTVDVRPGGRLAAILESETIQVNSLHRQALDRLAEPLEIEAEAEDGTVEAVSVRDASNFALGVQWHPEYWARTDAVSRRLFEAFGAALRSGTRRAAAAE